MFVGVVPLRALIVISLPLTDSTATSVREATKRSTASSEINLLLTLIRLLAS